MHVLLSINPKHVWNILAGTKKFEFRRKVHKRRDETKVSIYCTAPIKKLVGEFDITSILCKAPEDLWIITASEAGITKEFFDSYFQGRSEAYALQIGAVVEYDNFIDPHSLYSDFTPPQSFMYVPEDFRKGERQKQLDFA